MSQIEFVPQEQHNTGTTRVLTIRKKICSSLMFRELKVRKCGQDLTFVVFIAPVVKAKLGQVMQKTPNHA